MVHFPFSVFLLVSTQGASNYNVITDLSFYICPTLTIKHYCSCCHCATCNSGKKAYSPENSRYLKRQASCMCSLRRYVPYRGSCLILQVLKDCMKEEKVKGFMKVLVASTAAEGISFL